MEAGRALPAAGHSRPRLRATLALLGAVLVGLHAPPWAMALGLAPPAWHSSPVRAVASAPLRALNDAVPAAEEVPRSARPRNSSHPSRRRVTTSAPAPPLAGAPSSLADSGDPGAGQPDMQEANRLVVAAAQAGGWPAVLEVLGELQATGFVPTVTTYDLVIRTFQSADRPEGVIAAFDHLREASLWPRAQTYEWLFLALDKIGNLTRVPALWPDIERLNRPLPAATYNLLFRACLETGDPRVALRAYADAMAKKVRLDFTAYETLLRVLEPHEHLWVRALQVFEDMQQAGLRPTERTYLAVIKLCGQGKQVDKAKTLYHFMEQDGFGPSQAGVDALLLALQRAGRWAEALDFLRQAQGRALPLGARSYHHVIDALYGGAQWQQCVTLFEEMKGLGIKPQMKTHTIMIGAYTKLDRWQDAVDMVVTMEKAGLQPTTLQYTALVTGCARCQRVAEAQQVFWWMLQKGCVPDARAWNAVLMALMRLNDLEGAKKMLREMQAAGLEPSLVTWNLLIRTSARAGEFRQARSFLDELRRTGLRPDSSSFNALIQGCERFRNCEEAMSAYDDMIQSRVAPTVETFTALIGACQECGNWRPAIHLFDEMQLRGIQPNTITYTALLCVMRRYEMWQRALSLFEDMKRRGVPANPTTYNVLLHTLEKSKQTQLALSLFKQMVTAGVQPDATTYASIMGSLMAAGLWQDALRAWQESRERNVAPNRVLYWRAVETLTYAEEWWAASQLWTEMQWRGVVKPSMSYGAFTAQLGSPAATRPDPNAAPTA